MNEAQATGIERRQATAPGARARRSSVARQDWAWVGLIVVGYVVMLLLMPLKRDFGLLDDWAYMRAVEKVVGGQGFAPLQIAQAILVTHVYWGALFAVILGTGFTAVTAATMVMSLVGAIAFYVLLRRLGLPPVLCGLGVAILVLNPYYLYLTYTYMSEVTFVTLMLLSCIFYLEGLKGAGGGPEPAKEGAVGWLWLGSVLAALTVLTRQFGLALPVATLLWLFWSRRLSAGRATAIALVPIAAAVGYALWSSGFGTTFSGSVGREEILALFHSPTEWAHRAAHFLFFSFFLPGLTIPLWVKPKQWKWALALSTLTALVVYLLWQAKLDLLSQGQGSLGELSYSWLQRLFPDPTPVYCIGAALSVWLLWAIVEEGWSGTRAFLRRKVDAPPAAFFYLAGIVLFAGTYIVSAGFLDRYWLPLLPFIIAGGLSVLNRHGNSWLRPAAILTALVLTGAFGIVTHLEDYGEAGASWRAGRWLVDQGVPLEKIDNGYAWAGYYLYDRSMAQYKDPDVRVVGRIFPPYKLIDPQYVVRTKHQKGYSVLREFPYFSPLQGMATREMLAQKRDTGP